MGMFTRMSRLPLRKQEFFAQGLRRTGLRELYSGVTAAMTRPSRNGELVGKRR
jgi:hypothetical protein